MAFENLRDQLSETLNSLKNRIVESPTFNTLQERYEALPTHTQRGLIVTVVFIVLITLVSFPYTYFDNSSTQNLEYEENRNLLRKLLAATRLSSSVSTTPPFAQLEEIRNRVMNELMILNLQQEQIEGVNELSLAAMGSSLASPPITQIGLGVALKKLNLTQVVDLGFALQKMHPAVKLSGMDVVADESEPHYFNVMYKVAIFSQSGLASTGTGSNQSTGTENENFGIDDSE